MAYKFGWVASEVLNISIYSLKMKRKMGKQTHAHIEQTEESERMDCAVFVL